jgi:hypothetical protein
VNQLIAYLLLAVLQSELIVPRLFFAGFLSTAGRCALTFHDLLTEDPRHLQRVREDVDRIVKAARDISPNEPPRVEDHDFLNACITETARQHPIGTWIRWSEKPFALPPGPNGKIHIIPRGFVAVTTESIRTDGRVYDEAETYNPNRYFHTPFVKMSEFRPTMLNAIRLDSVRAPPLNMSTSMQPSFGVGAHQCAGRIFAYRMIGRTSRFVSSSFIGTHCLAITGTFITAFFESFDVELYQSPDDTGKSHNIVSTPLFGTRELVSEINVRLRRREVHF